MISPARFEPSAGLKLFHPHGVVHLVEAKRDNELWGACGQGGGYGTNSPVMHDCSTQGQEVLKRSEFAMVHEFRQWLRKL